ncbi:MAG: hypothetical protein ACLFV1_02800 [Thiohalophilus sp.]
MPHELRVNTKPVPVWFLEESYEKHRASPVAERINRLAGMSRARWGFTITIP